MARLPNEIVVQSRLQSGAMPQQARGTYINTPRQIRAPMLQPRSVPAPFQKAPIDRVGPVITQQAVQQFGNVLIDATANLADKKARMIADEKLNDFFNVTENYLKSTDEKDLGYLLMEGEDAVESYSAFQARVLKLEGNILNSTPNHAKTYLIPKIENYKKSVLQRAANHSANQYKVWENNIEANKLNRFQERLKDATRLPMKDVRGLIASTANEMKFNNALEKQAFIDNAINLFATYSGAQVVVAGEDYSTDLPLLTRADAFSKRIEKINRDASFEQQARNTLITQQISSHVITEINRRELQRGKDLKRDQDALMNTLLNYVIAGERIPVQLLNMATSSGLFGAKELLEVKKQQEAWTEPTYPKESDFATWDELNKLIRTKATSREINNALHVAVANRQLSKDDINSLYTQLRSMGNTDYNKFYSYLESTGRQLIKTTGPLAQFQNTDENYRLKEYTTQVITELRKAVEADDLTWDRVMQIQYNLERQYPPEIMLDSLPRLPIAEHSNLQSPRSLSDLDKATFIMRSTASDRSEEDNIKYGHITERYKYYILKHIEFLESGKGRRMTTRGK